MSDVEEVQSTCKVDDNINMMLNIKNHIVNAAVKNQFLQAAFISGFFIGAGWLIHEFYRFLVLPMLSRFYSSITIHNTDRNFDAVIDFVSDKLLSNVQGGQNALQATTPKKKMSYRNWLRMLYLGTSEENPKFEYRPESNNSVFTVNYKSHYISMFRSKDQALMGGYSEQPFTPERITLAVWSSNSQILKDLLNDALAASIEKESSDTVSIYTQSSLEWLSGWELKLTKKGRSRESVIFDDDSLDFLLNDAKHFLENAPWYMERDIPYRRGYLLYGPPGCGKTSFAQVLAGELHLNLCILNLTHSGLNDEKLADYLRDTPNRSMIVLEDVDSVFVERSGVTESISGSGGGSGGRKSTVNVSFSGFLNALDGVASQEGRILFMTTNHIERLDPALIRPGRCDVKFEVKKASKKQLENMFLRFFPLEKELALEFAAKLPADELSMATLQGHFVSESQTANEAIARIPELLKLSKVVIKSPKTIYEHLHRVGIEKYASLFEMNGILTDNDLKTHTIETLTKFSIELEYDFWALTILKKLIASEESFLVNEYSLAVNSTKRDMFSMIFPSSKDLVDEFCSALSVAGKSIISIYNLMRLLNSYKDHPIECIKAAKSYAKLYLKPYNVIYRDIDLYEFLKRAGLGSKLYNFMNNNIENVEDLLAEGKCDNANIKTVTNNLKTKFQLNVDEAMILAEIITKVVTAKSALVKFSLPTISQISDYFIKFYRSHKNNEKIDEYAFLYAMNTIIGDCDKPVVSLLEVAAHLSKYVGDPSQAVATVKNELISISKPEKVEVAVVAVKVEWDLVTWLKEGGEELIPYMECFVQEGLSTRDNLLVGEVLSDVELVKMGITKIGHQRKIKKLHKELLDTK